MFPLVHRPQAVPVDQLELRGLQPAGRDPGDGGPARGQGVEEPDDGPGRRGPRRAQPHGHLGDHAERALGSDHQPDEVVARHALRGAAAQPHDLAGGRDDLEGEHVVAGDAVLDAAQAAGVRGDVPADRRPRGARRVRRVPEPVLGGGGAQHVVHDARLHDREPLGGVDLDDPAHPLGREHDPALDRVRPAGQARARAAGHDRHRCRAQTATVAATSAVSSGRTTARARPYSAHSASSCRYEVEDVGVGQDAVGGECGTQLGQNLGPGVRPREHGSPNPGVRRRRRFRVVRPAEGTRHRVVGVGRALALAGTPVLRGAVQVLARGGEVGAEQLVAAQPVDHGGAAHPVEALVAAVVVGAGVPEVEQPGHGVDRGARQGAAVLTPGVGLEHLVSGGCGGVGGVHLGGGRRPRPA